VLADILDNEGEKAAQQIADGGADCRFVAADIADPSSIERLAANVERMEGPVRGLVNNAAIATNVGGAAFEDIDVDQWDRVMRDCLPMSPAKAQSSRWRARSRANWDRAASVSSPSRPASCAMRRPNTFRPSAIGGTRPDAPSPARKSLRTSSTSSCFLLTLAALPLTGQVLPAGAGFVFT
jgi:hypothetical protein